MDPLRRADGLLRLAALGLVEEGDGWLRLHRLLAHCARRGLANPTAQIAVGQTLIACGQTVAVGDSSDATLVAIIPHMVHVTGEAVRGADLDRVRELCNAAVQMLKRIANMPSLDPLTMSEKASAFDDSASTDYLAEPITLLVFERLLAIWERTVGPDHPITATSLNELGALLRTRLDPARVRPLFERALAIRERALRPDHPHTAATLNDLALLHEAEGDPAAARRLFERALKLENAKGPPGCVREVHVPHPETGEAVLAARLSRSVSHLATGARTVREPRDGVLSSVY